MNWQGLNAIRYRRGKGDIMKKKLVGVLGFVVLMTLFSCHQGEGTTAEMKENIEHPDHKKARDAREVLDKVMEHIANTNPKLSFENGELLDSELGVPHFNIVSFSEIEHFDEKDVIDGFIVRPVVDVDNPKLLIVLEAVDQKASVSLNQAMAKVKSDQWMVYKNTDMLTKYLIDNNKTVRQGNYLIYATWEDAEEIVKVFERHVR